MKYIFTFIFLFCSLTLFAGLDAKKIRDTIIQSRMHQKTQGKFYYEKVDSPEIPESVTEKLATQSKKLYGPYRLVLKDIPSDTRFGLYQCNPLGIEKPSFLFSGRIDRNGEAWVKKKDGSIVPLSQVLQFVGDAVPGAPIYSLIVLDDRKTYLIAHIIPKPIEAFGASGRHITMELFAVEVPLFVIHGEHFQADEKIELSIHTKEGVTHTSFSANPKGSFIALHEGDLFQRERSKESIQISVRDQNEPMVLYYDWKFLEVVPGRTSKKTYHKGKKVID